MKEIVLSTGEVVVVDDHDYGQLSKFKWNSRKGYPIRSQRLRANGKSIKKTITMSRQIVGCPDGLVVDHIDGNPLNNRRENLRICTLRQNLLNRRSVSKTSKFKGVCWSGRERKWRATIRHHRHITIGYFASEKEAAKAYDAMAIKSFGEYAWLNFPSSRG